MGGEAIAKPNRQQCLVDRKPCGYGSFSLNGQILFWLGGACYLWYFPCLFSWEPLTGFPGRSFAAKWRMTLNPGER